MSIRFENITVEEQVIYQDYIWRGKMVKITPLIMYIEYIILCSHGKFYINISTVASIKINKQSKMIATHPRRISTTNTKKSTFITQIIKAN